MKFHSVIEQARKDSGKSVNHVAKATKIQQSSLHRFLKGETGIRSDSLQVLFDYFGLSVCKIIE